MNEEIIDGYLINGINLNTWISIIAGFVLAIGAYFLTADILHLPRSKMIRAARRFGKKNDEKKKLLDERIEGFAISLSKKIRLSDYRKAQLQKDLEAAGFVQSPEEYIAEALVKAGIVAVASIPFLIMFPIIGVVILVMAFFVFKKETEKVKERVEKRRTAIEEELPRFVANIEKMLMHSRDVLSMLEGYTEIAGPELKKELLVTVSDMRTGNYEIALSRLESRVGSSYMSDVTRGLISVIRGDDTSAYWAMLALKFADYQRTLLKEKAAKIPAKVRRLSVSLLVCFMMIYVVVIGTSLVTSLGSLF